ncbi:hypothetical protein ACH5RR_032530 [Cinchona calisaya]|uniref:Uncharacterized protein n=1 Tax=Cinchona calisaya TaxID=153742 RepID=A0ABD2YID4_9GENT
MYAIKDQLGSIHFIAEGAALDGSESTDNTISSSSQFELVERNLEKPSELTSLLNVEKRLPICPLCLFAQLALHARATTFVLSVGAIASEQHDKVALGIGDKIQQQISGTSFEQLLKYSEKFAKLF